MSTTYCNVEQMLNFNHVAYSFVHMIRRTGIYFPEHH
jgi:hypothetical protein